LHEEKRDKVYTTRMNLGESSDLQDYEDNKQQILIDVDFAKSVSWHGTTERALQGRTSRIPLVL
jgi:hypothetical protein